MVNKSEVQQIRIVPWFVATAGNVIGTSDGYVHNFPNDIIIIIILIIIKIIIMVFFKLHIIEYILQYSHTPL